MQRYVLNIDSLTALARQSGFKSLSDLGQHLGFHRNTLGHFARGESIFPKSLHALFTFLGVDGRKHIQLLEHSKADTTLAQIVDAILAAAPTCCVTLFGSRSRGTNRPYSDYDLGLFSKSQVSHAQYLELVEVVEEVSEDFPFRVQLVNLCKAENEFLSQIGPDLRFLGGRMSDWIALRKAADGAREFRVFTGHS
jgi:predicted nucleotidyltransferase